MNNLKMKNFRVIGFDADDTLWVNEPYYQETEKKFCDLLSEYMPAEEISRELLLVEKLNLELYGYGTKAFMLSMIETALRITNCNVSSSVISSVISLGKQQLDKPVVLLDGIEEVLKRLTQNGIKIILASKGDLLDQERKLAKSNIAKYFHHIEIMSEKKEQDYSKLLAHLEIPPEEFVMVGNSLKSDILPVVNIGGYGIYIPYHVTWAHEIPEHTQEIENYCEIKHISEISEILNI